MKQGGLRIVLMVMVLLIGAWGSVWADNSPVTPSLNLTPEQWVGQSFLFLSLPKEKQSEGYEIFKVEQATLGFSGDCSVRSSYAEHVGKRVTVTDVVPYLASDNQYEYIIYLEENDTKKKLVGRTFRGQLEGLVLTTDLMKAQQQFKGKTIYVKCRALEALYNPQLNMKAISIPTKIGQAAEVVDVYAGMQSREPIWLVVSVDGQKAFLPIAYSWTNTAINSWKKNPPWQEKFMMEEFRAKSGWSEDLWHQIDAGVVQLGMNHEQVRFSWGSPDTTYADTCDSNGEIWTYGPQVLRFSGDRLISIEAGPNP